LIFFIRGTVLSIKKMPQLDFVSFHYVLNTLSFSYLFVYVLVTLFLFKPIFKEFFFFFSYPTSLFLGVMLFFFLYSDKVVFTRFSSGNPNLLTLKNKIKKRWDWFQYIPKLRQLQKTPN
jgi:hypothetical protein